MKELLLLEPVRKKGNHQFFMDLSLIHISEPTRRS